MSGWKGQDIDVGDILWTWKKSVGGGLASSIGSVLCNLYLHPIFLLNPDPYACLAVLASLMHPILSVLAIFSCVSERQFQSAHHSGQEPTRHARNLHVTLVSFFSLKLTVTVT